MNTKQTGGNGPKCNIEKSLFGKTQIEYFGCWLTRDGVKPITKS